MTAAISQIYSNSKRLPRQCCKINTLQHFLAMTGLVNDYEQ